MTCCVNPCDLEFNDLGKCTLTFATSAIKSFIITRVSDSPITSLPRL